MSALKPGDRLVRRVPEKIGDRLWNRVTITGSFDTGEGHELVLAPTEGFAAPLTATSTSVHAVYQVESESPAPEADAWVTPANAVTAP